MFERRLYADDMRVGLGVYETGKAITGGTTDALALLWILFVQEDANRQMKWPVPKLFEVVAQLLNPPLVADRRKAIRLTGRWFCGIFPANPMDLIKILRLCVVPLQVFVVQRPR